MSALAGVSFLLLVALVPALLGAGGIALLRASGLLPFVTAQVLMSIAVIVASYYVLRWAHHVLDTRVVNRRKLRIR